jgi:hypothetical protein
MPLPAGTSEIVIRDWLEVQAKWTSLQAIFMGSADIKKQLPDDTKAFMVRVSLCLTLPYNRGYKFVNYLCVAFL